MFSFLSEFLYSLQLLEGNGFSTAWRGQDFSLCHYQLHRWALHGARPGPSRGLTLAGGLGEGLARSRERIEQPPGSSDCMLWLSELSILYLVPMFHLIHLQVLGAKERPVKDRPPRHSFSGNAVPGQLKPEPKLWPETVSLCFWCRSFGEIAWGLLCRITQRRKYLG